MWQKNKTAQLSICGLLAALTATGAFLKINIGHVPITLQTLFVYLSGSLLSPGFAASAQVTYLVCGLIGIPVFASGGGPATILLPTFGYLLGFPLASMTIAKILHINTRQVDKNKLTHPSWKIVLLANATGAGIIFTLGVLYLYVNLNFITDNSISLKSALWTGGIIFIPGEIVKVIIAATIAKKLTVY